MQKKHPLTLLEVLIALMLCGMIVTTLLTFFHRVLQKELEHKLLKQHVMQSSLFEHNMKQLFGKSKQVFSASLPISSHPVLCITTYAGIDPEKPFCEELEHCVYLSEQNELCMTSTAPTKEKRATVFWAPLEHFSCRYFDLKSKQWTDSWQRAEQTLPGMCEITVRAKGNTTSFVFFLDPLAEPIVYGGKGTP